MTESSSLSLTSQKDLVYTIVPLSGRLEALSKFIDSWTHVRDNVHLTFSVMDRTWLEIEKIYSQLF